MYLEHFGLSVNPFALSPKLDFLYKSGAFEESIAHLVYGVDNSEAIVMITGAIGTGKTMALHAFLTNLGPTFNSALVTNTQVSAKGLLKLILEDLEVKFEPGCDKTDLLILFKDFLLEASVRGHRVVIVVDEAQNLSPEVLEEVRLLTNLGQGESQPVQIVLVGQPELEAIVNEPGLAQLRQRIRVHYRLEPLSRREVEEYLVHRMAVAGCTARVFEAKAMDRIYEVSRGVPRLVNAAGGGALLSAFVADRRRVEAGDVDPPEGIVTPGIATPVVAAPEVMAPRPVAAPEVVPTPPAEEPAPVSTPVPVATPPAAEPDDVGHQLDSLLVEVAAAAAPPPATAETVDVPRQTRRRPGKRRHGWVWFVAAMLAAVVTGLYLTGSLDDLAGRVKALVGSTPDRASAAGSGGGAVAPEPIVVVNDDPPAMDEPLENVPAVADRMAAVEQSAAEAVEPAPEAADPAPPSDPTIIHVTSFRAQDRAHTYAGMMRQKGCEARVEQVEISGREWFRVLLGPYASEDAARAEIDRLQQEVSLQYYRLLSVEPGS